MLPLNLCRFLYHASEEDDLRTKTYFGDAAIPNGYFHIKRERRLVEIERMRSYGVRACFAGHWHQNGGGWDGDLEMVITGAVGVSLGPDRPGFRLVKVFEDDIVHRYFASDEVKGGGERNRT